MSWRVMLLPFLGQQKLYQQVHLEKPEDLVIDLAAPIPSLAPGFWANYVNGSVRFILKDNSSNVINASMNGNDTMHE